MAREAVVWAGAAVWLSAVVGGFWAWERYDATPGAVRAPVSVSAASEAGGWNLTVFVHPRCSCSRAALGELLAAAELAPGLAIRVWFVLPFGAGPDWERGESLDAARRVPNARVGFDATGAEARRFGAETSGYAVLTAPDGAVVFRGGLTRARGRSGESPGRRAVLDWAGGRAGAPTAPVFGCELFAPGA